MDPGELGTGEGICWSVLVTEGEGALRWEMSGYGVAEEVEASTWLGPPLRVELSILFAAVEWISKGCLGYVLPRTRAMNMKQDLPTGPGTHTFYARLCVEKALVSLDSGMTRSFNQNELVPQTRFWYRS